MRATSRRSFFRRALSVAAGLLVAPGASRPVAREIVVSSSAWLDELQQRIVHAMQGGPIAYLPPGHRLRLGKRRRFYASEGVSRHDPFDPWPPHDFFDALDHGRQPAASAGASPDRSTGRTGQ